MTLSSTKKKIQRVVAAFKKRYPDDYRMVTEAVKVKRSMTADQFARIEGTHMRALFEMPEDLHSDLVMALDPDEIVWFKTNEGGRWFASTFKEFSLAEAI